jgi:hypothetical protein
MSRVAPAPGPAEQRRGVRRATVLGVVLLLPQLISGWFLLPAGWDLVTLVVPFVYVAGVLVLAFAATRAWKLRSDRLLPIAVAGVAAILLATVLFSVWPPDMKQYVDTVAGPAPLDRAVHITYLFVLVGALWQFGLFLLFGTIGSAVTRLRSRR